jgi:outer membrane protein assembly factor BamB
MNYRARWQQRRRQEARRRALILASVASLALLLVYLAGHLRAHREVWSRDLHSDGPVHMAAGRNTLFCVLPSGLVDGFNIDDGRRVWRKPVRSSLGFDVAPAAGYGCGVAASDAGTVSAYALAGGQLLWGITADAAFRCPPVIKRRVVLVGGDDGILRALDLAGGTTLWATNVGAAINSGCETVNQTLLCGTADGRLLGLDLGSGALRWTLPVGSAVVARPQAVGDRVVVATDGGRLYVVLAATGQVTAQATMPRAGLVRAAPVVDAQRVYVVTTDGWLVALGRDRLERQWVRKLARDCPTNLAIDGVFLYCADGIGNILVYSKDTGRVVRRFRCPSRVEGTLVITHGLVLGATSDGRICAFRVPTP